MNGQSYLLLANIAIWIGLGLYMIFIGLAQRNIERRLNNLENFKNDD